MNATPIAVCPFCYGYFSQSLPYRVYRARGEETEREMDFES